MTFLLIAASIGAAIDSEDITLTVVDRFLNARCITFTDSPCECSSVLCGFNEVGNFCVSCMGPAQKASHQRKQIIIRTSFENKTCDGCFYKEIK